MSITKALYGQSVHTTIQDLIETLKRLRTKNFSRSEHTRAAYHGQGYLFRREISRHTPKPALQVDILYF